MVDYHDFCIIENEHLYGPGKRLLLFTQGCSLHCEGCVNSHLWQFGCGNKISAEELLDICKQNMVDGITLHGGEPLDQAGELYQAVRLIKESGFTVILFTGYLKKELSGLQARIWNLADIVVCGRYDETKRNVYMQFRGSTNQRVITHAGKYKNYKVKDGETAAILTLDDSGDLIVKGFYTEDIEKLLS